QTGRAEESLAVARRLQALASNLFYVTGACVEQASAQVALGEPEAAEDTLRAGLAAGVEPANVNGMQAWIAARSGRLDEAKLFLAAVGTPEWIGAGSAGYLVAAALAVGERDLALAYLDRRVFQALKHTLVRLVPDLHPLLDQAPFAPRRRDVTLVWPLE